MPPPTETSILHNYLILPSPLPAVATLPEFAALFPRSAPQARIRALYRDLQGQRAAQADAAAAACDAEAKRGRAMRRDVLRARRAAERQRLQGGEAEGAVDDEVEIERALFGPTSTTLAQRPHTLLTILPDLERAVEDLELEARQLEQDEAALLDEVRQTVGGLSDLRYGRLANPKLRDEVLEGLQSLEQACKNGMA